MPKLSSTQEHLDIIDIIGRYVILKTGACAVVSPSPVNFDLLSEREQDAMIDSFASFLNSLNFSIQTVVRTKRTDISDYVRLLDSTENKQQNQFLKDRIANYREYIQRLASRKDVLDKKFYVVIPYFDPFIKESRFSLLPKRMRYHSKEILSRAKSQLDPKIDHVTSQLSRLGVKVTVLEEEELVELYYNIYNPTTGQRQHIEIGVEEYTAPMVEAIPKEEL